MHVQMPKGADKNEETKKPSKPKATGSDVKEKKPKAPPKPKPKNTKPLTPEELELAKGASLERNKALVAYIMTLNREQKEQNEFIKAALLLKAANALSAETEPIRCGKDVSHLPGIGPGTVLKIDAFFASGGGAPALKSAADDEHAWLEGSEKDVVVALIKSGSVTLEVARRYRSDITEDDLL